MIEKTAKKTKTNEKTIKKIELDVSKKTQDQIEKILNDVSRTFKKQIESRQEEDNIKDGLFSDAIELRKNNIRQSAVAKINNCLTEIESIFFESDKKIDDQLQYIDNIQNNYIKKLNSLNFDV